MTEDEKIIFKEYLVNHFTEKQTLEQNLDFLDKWKGIISQAKFLGVANTINRFVTKSRPVDFESPDNISMEMYDSFAGVIPIIYTRSVNDFENLVTNLVYKGVRPENISKTGASFIFGKSTRFIILSNKPYSNVPHTELGLDITEEEWKEKSIILRREHECVHYYTLQNFGISKNHLHDELMADFFGIYEAFGYYSADYFLHFIGVRGETGNRLKCYIPNCSEELYAELCKTAERCAMFLEAWSKSADFKAMSKSQRLNYLCNLGLEKMF